MTFSTAELPDEYESLRKTVEEFAHSVVAPAAAHHDATKTFPYAVVAQMGEMGLFGLPFPEEYGGMGGDYFALCLTLEELARADQSVAITLEAAVSLGAMPVYRYGSEEQKQRWLPELASGKSLAAFGLTEPGGWYRHSWIDSYPGGRGQRQLGHQRRQGIHHQLRYRYHRCGRSRGGDRTLRGWLTGNLCHPCTFWYTRFHCGARL